MASSFHVMFDIQCSVYSRVQLLAVLVESALRSRCTQGGYPQLLAAYGGVMPVHRLAAAR